MFSHATHARYYYILSSQPWLLLQCSSKLSQKLSLQSAAPAARNSQSQVGDNCRPLQWRRRGRGRKPGTGTERFIWASRVPIPQHGQLFFGFSSNSQVSLPCLLQEVGGVFLFDDASFSFIFSILENLVLEDYLRRVMSKQNSLRKLTRYPWLPRRLASPCHQSSLNCLTS